MIFGGGGDAAKKAARIQAQAMREAIAELRRQFDVTQGQAQPFVDAGTGLLPQQIANTTPEGLDANLNAILNGQNFQGLVDDRQEASTNALSSVGLTRSGAAAEEAARIPTDLAFQIEQLLSGRTDNVVGSGQNAVFNLAGLRQQNSGQIAGLTADAGRTQAQGILAGAQADAAGFGQLLNAGVGLGSILFSDPRLKESVHCLGRIKQLGIYTWEWIEDVRDTFVGNMPNHGFMADEVEEHYPEYVHEYLGWKVIDYPKVLRELD